MAGGTEITTAARKTAMLEALTLSFGVVAHAAKQVGIDRTTHYTWLDSDPEYKAAVADLKEYKKDFIESKLIKLINEGDTAALGIPVSIATRRCDPYFTIRSISFL